MCRMLQSSSVSNIRQSDASSHAIQAYVYRVRLACHLPYHPSLAYQMHGDAQIVFDESVTGVCFRRRIFRHCTVRLDVVWQLWYFRGREREKERILSAELKSQCNSTVSYRLQKRKATRCHWLRAVDLPSLRFIQSTKIHYHINLQQNVTSSFRVVGSFRIRTHRVGAKSPIFDLFLLVSTQP